MIVLPGLIDRHWHMWNPLARAATPTRSGQRFFAAMKTLSACYTPADYYITIRLALAEAAFGGVTSATNWSHDIRGSEYANVELQAMFASGGGGRFLYGYPQDMSAQTRMGNGHDCRALNSPHRGGARNRMPN